MLLSVLLLLVHLVIAGGKDEYRVPIRDTDKEVGRRMYFLVSIRDIGV